MAPHEFNSWLVAGIFLAATFAQASPPLGCVENSAQQRWCQSSKMPFRRIAPERDLPVPDLPHPATVKNAPSLYQPIRAVVAPIADLLPHYFEPRASQYGRYEPPVKNEPLNP